MPTGLQRIQSERVWQIAREGWTTAHDDQHTSGQLALAGQLYADCIEAGQPLPDLWPFDPSESTTHPLQRVA